MFSIYDVENKIIFYFIDETRGLG